VFLFWFSRVPNLGAFFPPLGRAYSIFTDFTIRVIVKANPIAHKACINFSQQFHLPSVLKIISRKERGGKAQSKIGGSMNRLTLQRVNGIKTGYWSPAKKDELIQRLGKYEDLGMEPEEIRRRLKEKRGEKKAG